MQNTQFPILLIPGWGGSGPGHWQTYMSNSLAHATLLQLPQPDAPVLQDWVDAISEGIRACARTHQCAVSDIIVIAHSMGCLALAECILQNPLLEVKCCVMVAPADIEHAPEAVPHTDFDIIEHDVLNCESVVIASDNDDWCSVDAALGFADDWNSEFYLMPEAGHISTSSGFGEWNALEYLESKGYDFI